MFAARKEFELLKLLATDKQGSLGDGAWPWLRLGFSTSAGHPHSHPHHLLLLPFELLARRCNRPSSSLAAMRGSDAVLSVALSVMRSSSGSPAGATAY